MQDKKQREKYEAALMEIVLLKVSDVISTSFEFGNDVADDDWT